MSDRSPFLTARLHEIIKAARAVTAKPNSPPHVMSIILGRPSHLKKLAQTRGLRMYLVGVGLSAEIRRYLKHNAEDDAGGLTPDQLELWPARLRAAVKDIGMARVFVPSRNEFVLLAPDSINAAETREAGDYLIAKGEDCIRRGQQLIQLARRM